MKPMYSIRDAVAQYYLPPFLAQNNDHAVRMMISSLGDHFPYRSGFMLYKIGNFDDDAGVLEAMDPVLVLQGNSIAASSDPRPRPIHEESAA